MPTVRPGQFGTVARVERLSAADLGQSDVAFFFQSGGPKTVYVHAHLPDDPRDYEVELHVDVLAPTDVTMTSRTGSVGIGNVNNLVSVYFGQFPREKGIEWSATLTAPEGVEGDVCAVQLTRTLLQARSAHTRRVRFQGTRGDWLLDDECPYTAAAGAQPLHPVSAGRTITFGDEDSPAVPANQLHGVNRVIDDEEYRTFVMFKPSGDAIFVPLAELRWGWAITASRSDADADEGVNMPPWSATPVPPEQARGWRFERRTAAQNPAGAPTSEFPEWTQSAQYYDDAERRWYDSPTGEEVTTPFASAAAPSGGSGHAP